MSSYLVNSCCHRIVSTPRPNDGVWISLACLRRKPHLEAPILASRRRRRVEAKQVPHSNLTQEFRKTLLKLVTNNRFATSSFNCVEQRRTVGLLSELMSNSGNTP